MAQQKKSFMETLTWVDWVLSLAAIGAIGYGLYRAYDLEPEKWSFVAGPLFALSSGFLFVLALRVQLREHRHAIDEMEQANVNHSQILQVARHEKEFGVCLQAVQHATEKLKSFKYHDALGVGAIELVVEAWHYRVMHPGPNTHAGRRPGVFYRMSNTEDVFPKFNELDELNVYMYWVLHSSKRKDLAADDRQYMYSLIIPIIRDVGKAQTLLGNIMQRMKELISLDDERLEKLSINRDVMKYHLKAMKALYGRREYKEEEPATPAKQ